MYKVFETAVPQVLNLVFPGNRWMLLEWKASTMGPSLHDCSYLYLADKYVILLGSLYRAKNFFTHPFLIKMKVDQAQDMS